MSAPVAVLPGSQATREGPGTTSARSSGARYPVARPAGAVRCAWAPCGVLFVPRATGGKPQRFHSAACRRAAWSAARVVCPHCGGSLRRTARHATAKDNPEPRNPAPVRRVALRRLR